MQIMAVYHKYKHLQSEWSVICLLHFAMTLWMKMAFPGVNW